MSLHRYRYRSATATATAIALLCLLVLATTSAFQGSTTTNRNRWHHSGRRTFAIATRSTTAQTVESMSSMRRTGHAFHTCSFREVAIANTRTRTPSILQQSASSSSSSSDDASASTSSTTSRDEIVARRIIVKGDVQGGYYRACVVNEAGKFRRLVGTMSPPDDTDEAEIYVEGKRNMVEGFVRWVQRSKVGMSQLVTVKNVHVEEPTGLYEDFYAPTKY